MSNDTNPPAIQVINVTPALAKKWLGENTNNRNARKPLVERYRRDMEFGRWKFAGDPIRFSITGRLIDGQHRCLAVASMPEGFSIPMVVITGLPDEAQEVMDQGSKRTPADQLKRKGIANASAVAAAGKIVLLFDEGAFFTDQSTFQMIASALAVEEWVESHPDDVRIIQAVREYTLRIDGAGSPMAAAAALIARVASVDLVIEFFAFVADGGAASGTAPNVLRNKLSSARRQGVHWSQREIIANFIRAWNAWVSGKKTTLSDPHHTKRGSKGWTEDNFPKIKAVA